MRKNQGDNASFLLPPFPHHHHLFPCTVSASHLPCRSPIPSPRCSHPPFPLPLRAPPPSHPLPPTTRAWCGVATTPGGPKLRRWYGAADTLPRDGAGEAWAGIQCGGVVLRRGKAELDEDEEGEETEEEGEEEEGGGDAVLVTDADSDTGQMVVLQLILARRRVRVLVKDAKEATAGFGPYVQPIAGSVAEQAAVRAALRGSQAVIVTGRLGSLAQLLQGSKVEHVVLVSQLGASSRPSGLAGLLWSASPLAAAADAEAALAAAAVAAGGDGERGAAGEARRRGFGCTVVRGGKVVDEPGRQRGLLLGQGNTMKGSVSREDLAAVVAAALAVPPPSQHRRIIEVGVWVGWGECWVCACPPGVVVFTVFTAGATSASHGPLLLPDRPQGRSAASVASAAHARPLVSKGKTTMKYVVNLRPTKVNGKIVGDKGASGKVVLKVVRYSATSYYHHYVLQVLNIKSEGKAPRIRRTTTHINSRYVDCGDDFGGGLSEKLSPFIARHGPNGVRRVEVEWVDSDGRPTSHCYVLHDSPLEGYPIAGTHERCVEQCTAMAEALVHNLDERLGSLDKLSGVKLFMPDEWPHGRQERSMDCTEHLESLTTLFRAQEAYKKRKPITTVAAPKKQPSAKGKEKVDEDDAGGAGSGWGTETRVHRHGSMSDGGGSDEDEDMCVM
ncbi:unnamed protein product [Closterium sp. Naga37s-1]|nr:unnamed protein product [Closterium sp. Naga37s-1]